jgi:hypothetical protein
MALRVGIMGAGRMAQGFDAPGEGQALSLAHAVERSSDMALGGFYDQDAARSVAAERKWNCPETPRARDAWLAEGWDVIFIATPDAQHDQDARDAIAQAPQAVLVEKPLALDADSAIQILQAARTSNTALMVDYPRRHHSAAAAVTQLFTDGTVGHPVAVSGVFSGAPAHAAVHMLDLFRHWCPGWSVTGANGAMGSHVVELQKDGRRIPCTLVSLPYDDHYVWEFALFCEHGRVRLSESPERLDISLPHAHPAYVDFDVLQSTACFDMEDEPLLERTMTSLVSLIRDPEHAQRHLEREVDSQNFVGAVLREIAH